MASFPGHLETLDLLAVCPFPVVTERKEAGQLQVQSLGTLEKPSCASLNSPAFQRLYLSSGVCTSIKLIRLSPNIT